MRETERTVVGVHGAPKPPPTRISLTLPAIRAAREVWLLAAGEDKADAVAMALSGAGEIQAPAAGAYGRAARCGCWTPPRPPASPPPNSHSPKAPGRGAYFSHGNFFAACASLSSGLRSCFRPVSTTVSIDAGAEVEPIGHVNPEGEHSRLAAAPPSLVDGFVLAGGRASGPRPVLAKAANESAPSGRSAPQRAVALDQRGGGGVEARHLRPLGQSGFEAFGERPCRAPRPTGRRSRCSRWRLGRKPCARTGRPAGPSTEGVSAGARMVVVGRLPGKVRCGTCASADALGAHLLGGLSEGEGLALGEKVRHQQVVLVTQITEFGDGVGEADQVGGDHLGALVEQLVVGVLTVGARRAPDDGPGLPVDGASLAGGLDLPLDSMSNCWR